MGRIGVTEIFVLIVIIATIYTVVKTSRNRFNKQIKAHLEESEISISIKEPEIEVPDTCPHCKSPNTKKLKICEWCGNQII
jgi:hypothetical protein